MISASLFDLVLSISNVIDLISPDVKEHHARVACTSLAIAREMQLNDSDIRDLVLAALLHDVGIISSDEYTKVMEYDSEHVDAHANNGWVLLREFRHLTKVSEIIRHHHVSWEHSVASPDTLTEGITQHTPLASHIVHLADRIHTIIGRHTYGVLCKVDSIVDVILKDSGKRFSPLVVDAFMGLSKRDSFWLDQVSPNHSKQLLASVSTHDIELCGDDLLDFANIMAKVIDFRCSFTATHSNSVAHVSAMLAYLAGLSPVECRKIKLAGYLHDIGKLAIPREIIEKTGKLSPDEYSSMRTHVYHTRQVLQHVAGFEDIVTWASQHHERLDGSGYPDCCPEECIPLGSRIIAVADVFAALSEVRPYRQKQSRQEIIATMLEQSKQRLLDPDLVSLLVDNIAEIENQMIQVLNDTTDYYGGSSSQCVGRK